MKKEFRFEMEGKDFVRNKEVFISELIGVFRVILAGCESECEEVDYALGVYVSAFDDKNELHYKDIAYGCYVNVHLCDEIKKDGLYICECTEKDGLFSQIYSDIHSTLLDRYIFEDDFFYEKVKGVVFNKLVFVFHENKQNKLMTQIYKIIRI